MSAQIGTVGGYTAAGDDGPETELDLGGKIEGGASDTDDVDHFGPSGDDSPPLPDDSAVAVELDDDGEQSAAVAYSDGLTRTALPGEKRFYARDTAGAVVSEIHMTRDGGVRIEKIGGGPKVLVNADGSIELSNSAATVSVSPTGAIKLSGTSVSLQSGTSLGVFLNTLHAAMVAWVPVPTDGGAALKAVLGPWFAQPPPSP